MLWPRMLKDGMGKILAITFCFLIAVVLGCASISNRSPALDSRANPFQRIYAYAEPLSCRIQMTHTYDGAVSSTYDARALGVVKSDDKGFFEEFEWVSVTDDGHIVSLSPEAHKFRQVLSLIPPFKLSIPQELTSLGPSLIGPITDLLTFYVDESLAIRQPSIQNPGDHVYLKTAVASSWGSGQDCIDFEITLLNINQTKRVGEIKVNHVPPEKMCIKTPAKWMNAQVTKAPNNWFDIKHRNGKWLASAGMETFEVIQQVDLKAGKILSATMANPVIFQSRECTDEKLLNCSEPTSHKIVRKLILSCE